MRKRRTIRLSGETLTECRDGALLTVVNNSGTATTPRRGPARWHGAGSLVYSSYFLCEFEIVLLLEPVSVWKAFQLIERGEAA